jgi:hypothetical protein
MKENLRIDYLSRIAIKTRPELNEMKSEYVIQRNTLLLFYVV